MIKVGRKHRSMIGGTYTIGTKGYEAAFIREYEQISIFIFDFGFGGIGICIVCHFIGFQF